MVLEGIDKIVLEIKVPERDEQTASQQRFREQKHRRDWISQTTRKNVPNIRRDYGVTPVVTKRGDDTVLVEIPMLDQGVVKSKGFQGCLFSGVSWAYSLETHFVGGNGDKTSEDARGGVSVSQSVLQQLSEYQNLGGSPEELARRMRELEGDAGASLEGWEDTQRQLAVLKKNWINPEKTTLEELSVLTARLLLGDEYAGCAARYEEIFPGGIDEDMRRALEVDKKSFVLTPEIVEMCSAANAAIELNDPEHKKTIENIIYEAEERSKPFGESGYYKNNRLAYAGALGVLEAVRQDSKKTKKSVMDDIVEDAKKFKKEYEGFQKAWEEKRDLAFKVLKALRDRAEIYEVAKEVTPDKSLNIEIPIFAFSYSMDGGRGFYLVLPTDESTEDTNLTRALKWDLTHSVREALGGRTDVTPATKEVRGSKVVIFYIPTLQDGEETTLESLIPIIKERYDTHVLSKVGARIRVYDRGEL